MTEASKALCYSLCPVLSVACSLVYVCRLIEWDAVEAPSQMQEKWVYDSYTLNSFAKHWQTNASIPQDLLQRIQAMRTYRKGEETAEMFCQNSRDVYLDSRAWQRRKF